MSSTLTEITGTFQCELIRFDDYAVVGSLTDGTRLKGRAEREELVPGIPYKFVGEWGSYRGQQQFQFKQFTKAEPHTKHGVVKYLEVTAPHIGPVLAGRLWDEFRQDAVKVLRTDPERASAAINGLPLDRAQEAAAALSSQAMLEDTRIDLMDLFAGRGFPGVLVNAVLKKWGIHAPDRVRRDPFSLLVEGFAGCGFARCDRLYCDLGLPVDSLKRQMICLWHAMQEQSNGHTWHLLESVMRRMKHLVSGNVRPRKAIELGVRSRWLRVRQDDRGIEWIAVAENAEHEAELAEKVKELQGWVCSKNRLAWPPADVLAECTNHQREMAAAALSSTVGILTGGPGTGKTFTVASIVRRVIEVFGSHSIAIAAPTGKAAVRCTAAFANLGLSSLEATTIHRLLGVGRNGHDGKGWGFIHNESNPLLYKFLIIDEASMLDTDLCCSIFRALQIGTHVLLVGDPYQLPPVGHGAPLRDMLATLPSGELTKIERNSGDIIRVCQEIRSGAGYRPSSGGVSIPAGRNVRHWETRDANHSAGVLHDLLCSPPSGIDPVWDVQVICAVNEKSELGRRHLNKQLQELFNPAGERVAGCPFRVGDKVICTRNSVLPLDAGSSSEVVAEVCDIAGDDYTPTCFVANGEIGKVAWLQKGLMKVEFDTPRRLVRVPMGKGDAASEASGGADAKCEFDLGYAITCHKAQGSQAPVIITMIDDSGAANQVCTREWHMTAMSRPERLLVTIGKVRTVNKQCRKVGLRDRKTFLAEMLG